MLLRLHLRYDFGQHRASYLLCGYCLLISQLVIIKDIFDLYLIIDYLLITMDFLEKSLGIATDEVRSLGSSQLLLSGLLNEAGPHDRYTVAVAA